MSRELILDVKNLSTTFRTERGPLKAIDGIDFQVYKGEILGIVGESGCGKSVTSQSVMRLYDEKYTASYQGEVFLEGEDLMKLPYKKMQEIRGKKISMVFQDALSSLNPVFTVGNQICEPLKIHQKLSKKEAEEKAIEMLKLVGIPAPEKRIHQYPHELSGGMRQRVMIAIALACKPQLLIADEPTTALDVTIQAQIMDLIVKLNQQLDMGVMLTNKNWETPYYAHIGDKDKLGNMWSANLHYLNIPIHIGYMMPVSKKISLFMNAGPYWGVGLFGKYTMTSGDKDTTIAENIFKDYLKRFDCGIGWNRY